MNSESINELSVRKKRTLTQFTSLALLITITVVELTILSEDRKNSLSSSISPSIILSMRPTGVDMDNCRLMLAGRKLSAFGFGNNNCKSRQYNQSQIVGCFRLYKENTERLNHIVFWGDSRLREQYHAFAKLINGSDDYLRQPLVRDINSHGQLKYYDNASSVTLMFNFDPLHGGLKNYLLELLGKPISQRPTVVVLGSVLWYLATFYQEETPDKGLTLYKDTLRSLIALFDGLQPTTKIVWALQGPFSGLASYRGMNSCCSDNLPPHKRSFHCCQNWRHNAMRHGWISQFNKAAEELFRNEPSVYLWHQYHLVAQQFAFDMVDGQHFMPLVRGNRMISDVLYARSQTLLNFHCNRVVEKKPNYGGNGLCCDDLGIS